MPFLKLQSNAKTTSKINKLKEYKQYETKKTKRIPTKGILKLEF